MFLSFNLRHGLYILACALLFSGIVNAQETRGSILGTVTDTSGAVVSGATVIVTNTDINARTTLTTNDKGYYEAGYQLAGK